MLKNKARNLGYVWWASSGAIIIPKVSRTPQSLLLPSTALNELCLPEAGQGSSFYGALEECLINEKLNFGKHSPIF